jgi:hypothetical protein
MEFIGGVLVAVIAAVGGITLDRHFQQRDLQREVCLEFLKMTENLWTWLRSALEEDRDQVTAQNEVDQMMNEVMPRVHLLASDRVRHVAKEYHRAVLREANAAIQAVRHSDTEVAVAIEGHENGLAPEREAFIEAARRELRGWSWRRRKSGKG